MGEKILRHQDLLVYKKAIEAAMKDPEYIKAARNDAPFLSYLGGADWTRQLDLDRKAYEEIARTLPKE